MKANLSLKKWIFRMAAKTLLVPVDCVLYILKAHYAYEKCSPDLGDSNDIKKVTPDVSIGLYVRRKRFSSIFNKWYSDSGGHLSIHFDIHIPKRLYKPTLRVSKNFSVSQIKNLLPQFSQKCSGESKTYIHHSHISWNGDMQQEKVKKTKTVPLSALLK